MDRRRLLGLSAVTAASSLAGCSQLLFTSTEGSPNPHIDPQLLDENGWEHLGEDQVDQTTTVDTGIYSRSIDITGRTDYYDDANLRSRVRDETLGQMDTPLRLFFTTKLEMDPNPAAIRGGIADGIVLDEMDDIFENRFMTTLEHYGILEPEQAGDQQSLEIDTGATARFYEYVGTYEYDDITVPVGGDAELTIPGGEVEFNAAYALWIADGFVLAAGGGYPTEDVQTTTTASLSDAISAEVDIDLEISSDEYQSELRTLIKAVE